MPLTDLPLEQLRTYRSDAVPPADFDGFWARQLAALAAVPPAVELQPHRGPWRTVDVWDVSFAGADGARIRGWLTAPAGAERPLPGVVEYVGYGGGRGLPGEQQHWASAGFAHLLMDTRGQGGTWGSGGDTPDPSGSAPATPGMMTRGIADPEEYYYRRLFLDAVRAVGAIRTVPWVDPERIAVRGASQGGGIALAVAGLVPDLVAVMSDVPFLCDFRRATRISTTDPYGELVRYLRVYPERAEQVFATLDHFDGVHFASRAHAPALFSVGLMDPVCPPSTVFAAHNAYAGDREMVVYDFAEHSGGGFRQVLRQIEWLRALLAGGR